MPNLRLSGVVSGLPDTPTCASQGVKFIRMLRTTISNDELKLHDVPPSDAEWKDIALFARTFNGYSEGSLADAGALANRYRGVAPLDLAALTLTEVRVCLFFEYRRCNHIGGKPEGEDLKYIRSLVNEIRARLNR